ncbi:hypothetical protein Aph02nite_41350 [Actinoplanes philippinensis]|uniref:PknH-like extracellular domain-containing protein n=1 Tax=Actinoplanes philippinensis TaxID=35752 RepID=A0A1I2GXV2_9ACTN|nr:hypothetical protein [Actinoplanes philippinensis]GIE78185.1 hypothetical protein Aph02nite_41350 [Actinoplanes philippinensis]SFF21970.1 hypothetical protein SAMN05421541_107264 [Actinoplanes philippinensis]
MFLTARPVRAALGAACALVMAAGCSSSDEPGPDAGLITVTTMRGAFLQPAEIGPAWAAPEESAAPQTLVSFCGGTSVPPQTPPGAELVYSNAADEGEKGAQTLQQSALVYGDADSATAGLSLLRTVADQCPKSSEVPAAVTADRNEPAYTETVEIRELDEGGWTGFVIVRHKLYEAAHPGTADVAVAVLRTRNVVLVDSYAIYQLNNGSPAPNFETDWKRLVGSVVKRVG